MSSSRVRDSSSEPTKTAKKPRIRSKWWLFLSYPESSNWEDIAAGLRELQLPFERSPLHDEDVNKDGTIKKPHYHWILHTPRESGLSTVAEMIRGLGGTQPLFPYNLAGNEIYLDHDEEDEKAKYDPADRLYWMLDHETIMSAQSAADKKQVAQDAEIDCAIKIIETINEMNFTEFYPLVLHFAKTDRECFKELRKKASFYTSYINSRRYYVGGESAAENTQLEEENRELREDINDLKRENESTRTALTNVLLASGESVNDSVLG